MAPVLVLLTLKSCSKQVIKSLQKKKNKLLRGRIELQLGQTVFSFHMSLFFPISSVSWSFTRDKLVTTVVLRVCESVTLLSIGSWHRC